MVSAEMAEQDFRGRGAFKGWNAKGAMTLPDIWYYVDKYKPNGFPLSTATLVSIFFEETACCNMIQMETPAAIGPGQLQISEKDKCDFFASLNNPNGMGESWDSSMTIMAVKTVFEGDKAKAVPFWRKETLYPREKYPKLILQPLQKDYILNNNEFSVKMHVKFFEYAFRGFLDGSPKGAEGLLMIQAGKANAAAIQKFQNAAAVLDKLMLKDLSVNYSWSGSEWAAYRKKRRREFANALNEAKKFKSNPVPGDFKFWEFFLPDDFLADPLGYVRCGF